MNGDARLCVGENSVDRSGQEHDRHAEPDGFGAARLLAPR